MHGGSGVAFGVIEQLRNARPQAKFLELVHRLDRETSGVLMLAKKRSALVDLHEQIRENRIDKRYYAVRPRRLGERLGPPADREGAAAQIPDRATASGACGSRKTASPSHTVFNLIERWTDYALGRGGTEDGPHASDSRAYGASSACRSPATPNTATSR